MADVNISKFRTSVNRPGSAPASPGFAVSEGQDPVHPSGSSNFVTYSGATDNVDLGEFGLDAGFITLDTTPTNTPTAQGTMFWDADDETIDVILNGYTMKIGEDLFYPVKNQTGSTIAKGTAVRFNGTVGASGRLLIAPFIANGSVPSSRFMGVTAEEILDGEDGKVLYFGRIRGINTNAFNEGDILYASTTVAGGFQTAIPVAPNNIVQVAAVVTKSINQGTIFVRPTLGSSINKDEGVKITSVADKDLLQYKVTAGVGLWENQTLAQVIGSAYVPSTRNITINGTTQDLSADRTFTIPTHEPVTIGTANGLSIAALQVLSLGLASASTNGALSSSDWTTFNNKQNALTNPVTGTGTTNYLPKFTGSTTIGNSLVFDNGTNVGIGTASPNMRLHVSETINGEAGLRIRNISSEVNAAAIFRMNNDNGTDSASQVLMFLNSSTRTADGGVNTFSIRNNIGALRLMSTSGAGVSLWTSTTDQRMTITSVGNLLVGTTTDNGARLQVSGETRLAGELFVTGSTGYVQVGTGTLSKVSIESTGTIGIIGTRDASDLALRTNLTTRLTIASTGAATFSSSVTAASLISASATFSNFGSATAAVVAFADGNTGFFRPALNTLGITTAGTERLRITSSGNVLIGTTTDNGARLQVSGAATFTGDVSIGTTETFAIHSVYGNTKTVQFIYHNGVNDNAGIAIRHNRANLSGETGKMMEFYTSGSNKVGSITSTLSATAYNTSSDYRLKTDLKDYNGLDLVNKIKTYDFAWKTDNTRSFGVIAHELQEVINYAVTGQKNGIEMQGVDYSKLVPIMVKAIQELKQEIDTLKN